MPHGKAKIYIPFNTVIDRLVIRLAEVIRERDLIAERRDDALRIAEERRKLVGRFEQERDELRAKVERLNEAVSRNIDRLVNAGFGCKPNDEPYLLTGAITLILDRVCRLQAERDELRDKVEATERTLTLPNGTVVRAGDVLIGGELFVVRLTAIGETKVLYRIIVSETPREMQPEVSEQLETFIGSEWRHWSEVYPDLPVPGGG